MSQKSLKYLLLWNTLISNMTLRLFLPTSRSGQLAPARQQHQLKPRFDDGENNLLLVNVDGVMLLMMVVMVMIVLARQQHQLELRLVNDHLIMLFNVDGDDNVDDEEQMMMAYFVKIWDDARL